MRNKESVYHLNDNEDSNTSTDLSRSDRMQNDWREITESTDKDPSYSLIDDAHLSVSKASFSASHSSPEPYLVPITKAGFDEERKQYENLGDPHTSNTAEQHKEKPLCHFESYTSGVDEES